MALDPAGTGAGSGVCRGASPRVSRRGPCGLEADLGKTSISDMSKKMF
ncbi:CMC1 isoform 4 [Pan troglodytes]|uniref:CMC1 isoform 4 n=1 Tax=Pan troglodytes TaxID=9598 RepID=A0A2J8NPU0_PANTR|nr:CMC1 isoform 4 [Pan troglodytes]